MKNLNWNFYKDTPENMLAVIEGKLERSGGFDRNALFAQSLERLSWHIIIALWGVETMKKLYTPQLKRRLRPQLRGIHDFAFSVLRGEPIPAPRWGSQYCKTMQNAFLSDRRNRNKQRVL
ncbi:MAG: hypothetical protein LBO62_00160 [Endomicrobium sp.]|nr:hypothetical protein [Endomicrobium sp.]